MSFSKPVDAISKTIRDIYDVKKPYFIDIYQREYKWTKEPTIELLKDIERGYQSKKPYFLNSYLVSDTKNKEKVVTAIIDGQQRLTTILLILIKLKNIVETFPSSEEIFSLDILKNLITKRDDYGNSIGFIITNKNREEMLKSLYESDNINDQKDETQKNMQDNYKIISDYYEKFLENDTGKINKYIEYLLGNVSAIELKILDSRDVAMIFEVVNDRGVKLKSHEILKAKLLSVLDKDQKEQSNKIWIDILNMYFKGNINIDIFFRDYIRARYHIFEAEEKDYHKLFDTNEKLNDDFGNLQNQDIVFEKVTKEIKFYAELYFKLITNNKYEYIEYNKSLGQGIQYILCLSAINIKDSEAIQDAKINTISRYYEKWHMILNLWNIYDSNRTDEYYREVLKEIIDTQDIVIIEKSIDSNHIKNLNKGKDDGYKNISLATDLFSKHKDFSHKNKNITRYVLMRIELELSKLLGMSSRIQDFSKFGKYLNQRNNSNTSIHIEHIYTYNEKNLQLFDNDQDQLEEERNKLGMVLLLQASQNQSSGADLYSNKIECYKKSNFIWNELLSGHIDNVLYKKLPAVLQINYYIEPGIDGVFPVDKIRERQEAVFNIIKYIWSF